MIIDCVTIAKFDTPVFGRLIHLTKRYHSCRITASQSSSFICSFIERFPCDSVSVESTSSEVRFISSSLFVNLTTYLASVGSIENFKDVSISSSIPTSLVPYNLKFVTYFKVIEEGGAK